MYNGFLLGCLCSVLLLYKKDLSTSLYTAVKVIISVSLKGVNIFDTINKTNSN